VLHHQSLKDQFEKLTRSYTEFLREHRIDLVQQMLSGKSGKYDPSLVPSKLLENTAEMAFSTDLLPNNPDEPQRTALDAYAAMYENFIDGPILALDEQTPRSASQNPLMRSRLLRLMQTHIRNCDEKRRKEGVDIDLNPLLRELGLDELISEPPPLGVKKKEISLRNSEDDFLTEALFGAADPAALSPLSRLHGPSRPLRHILSIEEVEERTNAMFESYSTFEESVDAVHRIFPGVLDFTFELLSGLVGKNASSFAVILASRACIVMAGTRHFAMELDFGEIVRLLREDLNQASKIVDVNGEGKPAVLEDWISSSPQPNLMLSLMALMMDAAEDASKKHRVSAEKQFVIFAFIKSLVIKLSHALDEPGGMTPFL
jgi:hypothetical protein